MRWKLHGLTIEGITNDTTLQQSWQTSFSSLPHSANAPDLICHLNVEESVPTPPSGEPDFRQGELLQYFVRGQQITVHFPRFGQLQLNLATGETEGQLISDALTTYGVLEDLIAISLSPHLRRRGMFLIHAFAAAMNETAPAVLLVGGIGAGKTTTGMSLLNANWRLLSNDSPIIDENGRVLSYPGVLAAYPETFARFEATNHLANGKPEQNGRAKLSLPAKQIWPNTWLDSAPIGVICFPQIEQRDEHHLEPIPPPAALARLMPHAIEQWDKAMIPRHLTALRKLVEAAPTYILHLSPNVQAIPTILASIPRLSMNC